MRTTRGSIASPRPRTVAVVLAAVRNNLQGIPATVAKLRGAVAAGC